MDSRGCARAGIGAYLGYNISLTLNGPVLTAASLTLTPAFAAIQAMALIGERLGWYHAAAIFLVVIGLIVYQPLPASPVISRRR